MSTLTIFETSQLIANELQISSIQYDDTFDRSNNNIVTSLTDNYESYNKNPLSQVSFIIASYVTSPNHAFQDKLIESLSDSKIIDTLSVPTAIIQTIVKRFLFGIKWDIQFNQQCLMSFIDEQEQQNRFNETDSSDTESDHLFFDETEEEEQKVVSCDEYFKYDLKQSLIKYPMEIVDALNIPTSFQINLSEYKNRDYQYIFHINIRSKGDESFIGLTDKSSYKSFCNNPNDESKLIKNNCILYYGGREKSIQSRSQINMNIIRQLFDFTSLNNDDHNDNIINNTYLSLDNALMNQLHSDGHGAIYENGVSIIDKLTPFRSGDWISICIENNLISFYNNSQLIYLKDLREDNKLFNKDLILFSLVDYDNDAIFIEQSHSKNGLNTPKNIKCK